MCHSNFQSKLKGKILSNAELPQELEGVVAEQLGWRVSKDEKEKDVEDEGEEEEELLTGS